MGEGEGKALGEELLDVGALDIVGLLELDDLEDLFGSCVSKTGRVAKHTTEDT